MKKAVRNGPGILFEYIDATSYTDGPRFFRVRRRPSDPVKSTAPDRNDHPGVRGRGR